VLRTPQNNEEEGARTKNLVTCGTRGEILIESSGTAVSPVVHGRA